MNKQVITIFTIILSITIVSAITIYSGECRSIEFPNTDDVNWSVKGNSSNMDGFSYEKNGTTITYCFDQLYKPDNFTVTFYNYQSVEVEEEEDKPVWYSFGCTYNKNYDWNCSEWSECINGTQIRTCKEKNNCGNTYGRPNITQSCTVEIPPKNDTDEPIIEEKPQIVWFWIILIVGVVLIILLVRAIIKNKKAKPKDISK